jgi:predicted NAD-dependent protein-ADP-ribosyltransferase YbiA (DUF1768 family)
MYQLGFTVTAESLYYLQHEGNTGFSLYPVIMFTSAEQYMIWAKAFYFNDVESAKKILVSTSRVEARQLGRAIKRFCDDQ